MLPSTSTVPYDETTHPRRTVTGAPLAGTAGSPRTGLRGLLAGTSAGERTDAGLIALAAAAAFAAAYLSSLMLWRRLQRVRAGTR